MLKKIKKALVKLKNKEIIIFSILMFIIYLSTLSISLDDEDSIHFANAIEDFDVGEYRPHPPGYPVYIFLAKISNFFFNDHLLAMTFLSALFGSLSIFVFYLLIYEIFDKRMALMSSVLLAFMPIFWLNSLKAMSDIPGLFFMLCCCLLTYKYIKYLNPKYLYISCVIAGIAAGVRLHTTFVTIPLIIYSFFINNEKTKKFKLVSLSLFLLLASTILWIVPTTFADDNYLLAMRNRVNSDSRNRPIALLLSDKLDVVSYLDKILISLTFFYMANFGVLINNMSALNYLFIFSCLILGLISIYNLRPKDKRFYFFIIPAVLYLLMVAFYLPATNPRYLLPITLLLPVAFSFSILKSEKYWKILFILFLTLVLFHSVPLAIAIHTQPAVPLQLMNYITENYDSNTVMLASLGIPVKYRDYYNSTYPDYPLPNIPIESREDIDNCLKNNTTVLTTNIRFSNNITFNYTFIKRFERDSRIHVKHSMPISLYEIS